MVELSDAERLHEVSRATNDDGTVDVELQSFNRTEVDNMVRVNYITPDGEEQSDVMQWPLSDSDEYKFVRLFEQAGYGIVAADEACMQNVTVKATKNPWSLHAPADETLSDKLRDFYENRCKGAPNSRPSFWTSLVVSGLFVPIFAFVVIIQESDELTDWSVGYGHAVIHILLYVCIALAIVMFI